MHEHNSTINFQHISYQTVAGRWGYPVMSICSHVTCYCYFLFVMLSLSFHTYYSIEKIAPNGGRRENFWGISCEKSRFYAKKILFFPILGEARAGCPPPGSAPEVVLCCIMCWVNFPITLSRDKINSMLV